MKQLRSFIRSFCKQHAGEWNLSLESLRIPRALRERHVASLDSGVSPSCILKVLLEELFTGNGYHVRTIRGASNDVGCDFLVKYRDSNTIRFVLLARSWGRPANVDDVKQEYGKFLGQYCKRYELNPTQFCLVTWAYADNVKYMLNHRLNIKAWDEADIVSRLLDGYREDGGEYPSIILEPYQQAAYERVLEVWDSGGRCYINHATGTGKTYTMAKLIQHVVTRGQEKILVLSPSVYINDRIYELLSKSISKTSIVRTFAGNGRVYLLTYQYLMYGVQKGLLQHDFGYIIMDEVHRAGAPRWHKTGLLAAIGPTTRIVGVSATMFRPSGGIDVKAFLDDTCAGRLTLFEAMARCILPAGKYVYSVLNMDDKIQEVATRIRQKYSSKSEKRARLLQRLDARQIKDYSVQKVIHKHYRTDRSQKIVVFCEDINHMLDIKALLRKTFMKFKKIRAFEVHSKRSRKENKAELAAFSSTRPRTGETCVLTAIDMLNEGIDVAGIDSVMLFRKLDPQGFTFSKSVGQYGDTQQNAH